jgi:hypothetical protein
MLVLIGEDPVATKNVAPGELLWRGLAKFLLDLGKICIDVMVPGLLQGVGGREYPGWTFDLILLAEMPCCSSRVSMTSCCFPFSPIIAYQHA